jgi:ankyrin repeat protein
MVQILLKGGAIAKVSNRNGVTPLWLAATSANAGIARELLNAGADANSSLPGGETVLMTAAESGNAELVELLLAHGASVGARENNYGSTALMFAAGANQARAAKVLIAHGAEVNGRSRALTIAKDRFGLEGVVSILPHGSWTPLMYAGRQGSVAAIRTLADSGADLNLTDPDGTTALLLAIMNGHYDAAALLVEKGADPNKADSAGMAPLYAATDENTLGEIFGRPSRTSHDELNGVGLMKVLLAHGADPNVKLKTPTLQRAHTPGEPTLGEGATPLMRAAKNGDVAAIKMLLDHGADIALPQKNGTTPLMFAAGLGRGVGTFAKDYATDGEMLAAAKLLVERGADVNAISVAGQTAIHFAAQAADTNLPPPTDDMVLLLASHGARLDVADKQGRRPIDMAAGKGLRGRAGGPVTARQNTIKLLSQLMDSSAESAATVR